MSIPNDRSVLFDQYHGEIHKAYRDGLRQGLKPGVLLAQNGSYLTESIRETLSLPKPPGDDAVLIVPLSDHGILRLARIMGLKTDGIPKTHFPVVVVTKTGSSIGCCHKRN